MLQPLNDFLNVGPQKVYQENSFGIDGFNRPNNQMKLSQARPRGGLRIGETFHTLLNENPSLPGAKIRVMQTITNATKLGPGWQMEIL